MIKLKRLNGKEFVLNAELIEQVEMTPDTVITLTTGNNIIVREDVDTVIKLISDYRKAVYGERAISIHDRRSEE